MQNILQKINQIYLLPKTELQLLLAALERVELPKNHLIMSTTKVERYLYFIEKGIAMAYCHTDKQQATFWFGQEGDLILSYHSYINQQPGYEDIMLLEDSILYRISNYTLQELYAANIGLANWGRKLAEQELIKTEERLINHQFKNASERYTELLTLTPTLLQRVQLKYLASYLGVTQVTLSRIRAGLK
ncbi:MAG: Crp/Fnr family transcriptional regulator [Bacteroidota bacterium]